MKVRLEIELEMQHTNDDEDITKTTEELLKGLTLQESDVIDGVEITTTFDDADNTEDYFIVPHSARIISKESMDFTEDMLDVEDMEMTDYNDGVNSQIALYLDCDKKFGTNINDDDSAWVNCYVTYYPDSEKMDFDIYIIRDNTFEDINYTPTDEEINLVKAMMEEYCQKENKCSIAELVQSYQEETAVLSQ